MIKTAIVIQFALIGLCSLCGVPAQAAPVPDSLPLVRNGTPVAVVVVDREIYETDARLRNPLAEPHSNRGPQHRKFPDRQAKYRERHVRTDSWPFNEPGSIHEAATVLVDMIERATGVELPIVFEPPAEGNVIYVGESETVRRFAIDQTGMDRDGFDIRFPDARSVVILGPGKSGTEFGAYEFLERFVGVRWLMPGDVGLDVPHHDTLVIPRTAVRQEPGFWSRRLTASMSWQRRLRIHHRIDKTHNLWALFWVEDYLESHPHFFPMYGGQRMTSVPGYTRSTAHSWQPCFSAEGLAEEAAAGIIEFFDLNPRQTQYYPTYPLAINDGGPHIFCQCPDCRAQLSGRNNVHGGPDYSAPYFRWANQVAERVAVKHPDKYLVTLAYQSTFEAPDFDLHPNIIVVICYDGMKMAAPETRAVIEDVVRTWNTRARTLGWYDYLYGRSYLLPRVYPRLLSRYYRFLHENGVRVITSQAGLHIGEAPKYYAAQKLKWDPHLNIDALLDDWYQRCGGEAAAPYLKQYFEFWEDYWTHRILEKDWGRHLRGRGTFLPFRHSSRAPTYLLDVTDDEMAQLREWMTQALEMADTDVRHTRMQILFDAFEYYETTRQLYQAGETTLEDPNALAEGLGIWIAAARKREHLLNEVFPKTPGLSMVTYSPAEMPFLGMDQVVRILWRHRNVIDASDTARDQLRAAVAETGDEQLANVAERIFALRDTVEVDPDALRRGLVLHLPFNDGQGDQATDQTPHANHGIIEQPMWVEDTPGGTGYSLGFGPETQVECPHHDGLNTAEAQTISVWIKLNDLGLHGWRWIFSKTTDAGHDAAIGWLLSGTHEDLRPDYGGRIEPRANRGGRWGPISPNYTLPAEQWFHAVAVYHHEQGGQLYIDAFPVSPTGTRAHGEIAVNTAPLVIRHGEGLYYDFRLYNRALSEAEIIALYQIGEQGE